MAMLNNQMVPLIPSSKKPLPMELTWSILSNSTGKFPQLWLQKKPNGPAQLYNIMCDPTLHSVYIKPIWICTNLCVHEWIDPVWLNCSDYAWFFVGMTMACVWRCAYALRNTVASDSRWTPIGKCDLFSTWTGRCWLGTVALLGCTGKCWIWHDWTGNTLDVALKAIWIILDKSLIGGLEHFFSI